VNSDQGEWSVIRRQAHSANPYPLKSCLHFSRKVPKNINQYLSLQLPDLTGDESVFQTVKASAH